MSKTAERPSWEAIKSGTYYVCNNCQEDKNSDPLFNIDTARQARMHYEDTGHTIIRTFYTNGSYGTQEEIELLREDYND